MSAIKFQVGEPKKLTLSFDTPKTGTNNYGNWYMYGFKSEIDSDEDCFFATPTLHDMIQKLGAKEGDEITIEKCPPEEGMEHPYFKVNGLTKNDIDGGKAFDLDERAMASAEKMLDKLDFSPKTEDKHKTLSEDEIPF